VVYGVQGDVFHHLPVGPGGMYQPDKVFVGVEAGEREFDLGCHVAGMNLGDDGWHIRGERGDVTAYKVKRVAQGEAGEQVHPQG
jgi:hypothetical protein